jgi:hypothetical protein
MRPTRVSRILTGVASVIALAACSADRSGLGPLDGGGSGGAGAGSGGAGSGGMAGGDGTGGTASGGRSGSGGASTGTGGTASGGRSGNGGRGTGGTASGGRTGTGGIGTGGRGNGGNPAPKPECTTAADCTLYSDCCTCEARAANAPPPPACQMVCIQSDCAAHQLPPGAVACVAGRCIAGFNCDASGVVCGSLTPTCAAGEVPSVNATGTCFAGGCVPASQCKTVTNCSACGGSAPACVSYQTQLGIQNHCVTIPTECGGAATCGCLGPTTCVSPYGSCGDFSGIRGVSCTCPAC